MSKQLKIAFCITCKGRLQHLQQTLPRNLRDNADYPHAVFVLLNYGSKDGLEQWIYQNHRQDIQSGRLVLYTYTQPGPFRMAHAKNLAHRLGILEGADVLVNMDADNFTGLRFSHYLNEGMIGKPDVFYRCRMIKYGESKMGRGVNGRIAVTKWQYMNAGGYDEKYVTWGPEDEDFAARLQRMGYEAQDIERQFLAVILHNNNLRYRDYPHLKANDGAGQEISQTNTIVNYGKIGLGVVYRNFDNFPIQVQTVPTKIFGIGMHKTATTSLHAALEILGYQSAHWKNPKWAKNLWRQMKEHGKSPLVEKTYALCDLPITVLYRELDNAYPGSKFILTLRDEKAWIESVRKHWSPANPFRASWDDDAFSHRQHEILYGRRDFDADVMLQRYRSHNAEVLEHFKHRPDDLLVMDMSKDSGWYELCGFLVQRIPLAPYPRSNEIKL